MIIQGGPTDSPTFVMNMEFRYGHRSGRMIAHSKAENVEFLSIIIKNLTDLVSKRNLAFLNIFGK